MQKQNFNISYRQDESIQTIDGLYPHSDENKIFPLRIHNAHLGKRNKVQGKRKDLKNLIFKHKVDRISKTFIKKIRLNSVYRKPSLQESNDFLINNSQQGIIQSIKNLVKTMGSNEGMSIGNAGLIVWSFINIVQITLMVFIFSIMMAFQQTKDFTLFLNFRIFSILLYIIDMFLNFTIKRYERGKYLQKISEISIFYLKNGFIIDLVSILIFPIDLLADTNITIFISFVAIVKLSNNLKKFEKFQYHVINSCQREQYYGLIKVFITNFAIGHFLSIFLNLMAYLNNHQNWHLKLGINNSEWYIKYIWGYYWGTNIMLTVGFGDIAATNYYEAIVLVFIETISCITLAYNINYVGALISSIRSSQEQKKKKLKTVHRMCKQNFVSNQMQSKVSNFIQQSHNIKQSFEYDVHDQVLKSLPKNLQRQYRKQANKTIFDSLGFLNNLSKKSLLSLAQQVSRKICHPEQILLKKGSISDFLILHNGCLSLTCRIKSNLDGKQIQTIDVKSGSKPKILSLDFIKNKTLSFNVKSNRYSVLYFLTRQDFMQCLRISQMDFHLFCMMKDKDEYILDQNNLYECSVCKSQYHNKFQCSRLHYIPLKQNILMKHLHQVDIAKQPREQYFSRQKVDQLSLKKHALLKQKQIEYIKDHFDDYQAIQNLYQFYKQKPCKQKIEESNTCNTHNTHITQIFGNSAKNFNQKLMMDEKAIFRLQQFFEAKVINKSNQIWDFEIDLAEDFNFYFNQANPENLKYRRKIKRDKIKFGCQL